MRPQQQMVTRVINQPPIQWDPRTPEALAGMAQLQRLAGMDFSGLARSAADIAEGEAQVQQARRGLAPSPLSRSLSAEAREKAARDILLGGLDIQGRAASSLAGGPGFQRYSPGSATTTTTVARPNMADVLGRAGVAFGSTLADIFERQQQQPRLQQSSVWDELLSMYYPGDDT
jgi:hypothetical protein